MDVGEIDEAFDEYRETLGIRRCLKEIAQLPPLASLRGYSLSSLPNDLVAGAVIAALSIPIAMGYAQIAGLSPIMGLYASMFPPLIFALLTNTRSIVFGMDGAAAAVTGSVVVGAGIAMGSPEAFALMPMLSLLVAAFLLLFALTRAGALIHYIPDSVMNGFIIGISITIIAKQVPKLLGAPNLYASDLASVLSLVHMPSTVLAAFTLCALFFIGKNASTLPGSLIVLVIGLAFSLGFGLEAQGVAVLGDMPAGLPSFTMPHVTGLGVVVMVGGAFSIAVTVMVESLLTLNTFSMREGTRPHGNRELLSFAAGNVAASVIGCPPCSASLSRTAAASSSGGTSQLAGIFGALIIAVFILVLAPFLRSLPEPVLASIIVYAMVQVIDFATVMRYAQNVHAELAVLVLVAVVVIVSGAIAGIAAGIVASLAVHFLRSHVKGDEELVGFDGDEPDDNPYVPSNMAVYHMHGYLSFTNIDHELEQARKLLVEGVDTIIFELTDVTNVDSTAAEAMRRLVKSLKKQGILVRVVRSLSIAHDHYTRYELRRMMQHTSIYPTVESAVADVHRRKRKQMIAVPLDDDAESKDA